MTWQHLQIKSYSTNPYAICHFSFCFDASKTVRLIPPSLVQLCYRKKKVKVDTAALKKDLKKMSTLATSLLIDQKALCLAESDENGYDLNSYWQRVIRGLEDENSDEN